MTTFFCTDAVPQFLNLFDFTVPPAMLFYSYIPIAVISLFMGIAVYIKDRFSLRSKLFLAMTLAFVFWVVNIMFQWVDVSASAMMFSWQITAIFEVLIPVLSFYFAYVLLHKKDIPIISKIILATIVCLVSILVPNKFNIYNFDPTNCQGGVGLLLPLIYSLELLTGAIILIMSISKYHELKQKNQKEKTPYLLGIGFFFFLTTFALSNIFGEITQIYSINLVGPVGMAILLSLLTYSIVKFKTFNVKIIGTQALVAVLWIMVGSLLFVAVSEVTRIVVAITEIIAIIFGLILIGSVKKEVAQREHIEKLAGELESANTKLKALDKQKTEFLSFASHQLRTPVTAIKGYASMVLEGSFGEIGQEAKGAVEVILQSAQKLVFVIEDFLNVTRIELGTIEYNFAEADLKQIVESVVATMKPIIDARHLTLTTEIDDTKDYRLKLDAGKISQVISNLIDNSIKYTKGGSIHVSLRHQKDKFRIEIKDTGVGIDQETMGRLFQKFSRAYDATRMNANGTGLGLYVARQLVEAHHGQLWAESDGVGKGTTFIVELGAGR
jgi:signal transduction histidine kinase